MAKVKDCPGFETFGEDVKEARKVRNISRKDLAEQVNIDTRYLANIEPKFSQNYPTLLKKFQNQADFA